MRIEKPLGYAQPKSSEENFEARGASEGSDPEIGIVRRRAGTRLRCGRAACTGRYGKTGHKLPAEPQQLIDREREDSEHQVRHDLLGSRCRSPRAATSGR